MNTGDLIQTLAADAAPVRPARIAPRLVAIFLIATAFWAAILASWLELPPGTAAGLGWFWMKLVYSFVLALAGLVATVRLARPGGRMAAAAWIALAAVAAIAAMAVRETMATAPSHMAALWLGQTWWICPLRILVTAAPIYAATLWLLRRAAPTRLALAGAGAGLFAGAAGATIYALYCQETAAAFVLAWYTLGIAVCAALGAAIGARLLRW
ncbi:MAG TPA: DUF1109 domain-containing protein [Caulobacteraceae bacterium]|jgi:hypothetical protein